VIAPECARDTPDGSSPSLPRSPRIWPGQAGFSVDTIDLIIEDRHQRAGAPARGVTEGRYAERWPNVRPAEENRLSGWPTVIRPDGSRVAPVNLCLRRRTVDLDVECSQGLPSGGGRVLPPTQPLSG